MKHQVRTEHRINQTGSNCRSLLKVGLNIGSDKVLRASPTPGLTCRRQPNLPHHWAVLMAKRLLLTCSLSLLCFNLRCCLPPSSHILTAVNSTALLHALLWCWRCCWVPPKPFLLSAKPPQVPQPLLSGHNYAGYRNDTWKSVSLCFIHFLPWCNVSFRNSKILRRGQMQKHKQTIHDILVLTTLYLH